MSKHLQVRLLLGPEEVASRLKEQKFFIDTFFTGGDFASFALQQIGKAIERRSLSFTSCTVVFWGCDCGSGFPQNYFVPLTPLFHLSNACVRYGFKLDYITGRACDCAAHSKKCLICPKCS